MQHHEPALPVTPTNSGNEAKGTILGLEGMAVVPVLVAAVVSILLVVVLVMGASGALLPRIAVALCPVGVTLAYVLLFVHKKPPNYQRDAMELWRGKIPLVGRLLFPAGVSFNAVPLRAAGGHPLPRAAGANAVSRTYRHGFLT